FVQIEKMPITANGKVDRKALPMPKTGAIRSEYIPPANEFEEKLVQIWAKVLGIEKEKISTRQNFFEMGGTSLNVISQLSLINKEFGIAVTADQIYHTPTIQAIARSLQSKKYVDEPVILLNRPVPKKFFCFPPGVGFGIAYQALANIITDYSFYSFNFIENENRVNEYIEIMTKLQPGGPFILFGWSAAGKLIFKVAAALENRGGEVSDIILADCFWDKNELNENEEGGENKFMLNLEKQMDEYGIGYLKEKVRKKNKLYYEYLRDLNQLDAIHANVHLIISEESQNRVSLDRNCWHELSKTVITYNGFGKHNLMFNEGPLEKNAELIKKILNKIDPGQ
ncbi:MAG TPA: phosphopantetheine-binding protein, partial [Candidatus Deferrimicrobium sp.]|nr:phosphopantetheine-binding protein [Candidatus Deferrimicrobium sp.]